MVNNSDNSSNNGGIRGRFRDRLRLIRINRYKMVKHIKDKELENKKFIEDKVKEIREVIRGDDSFNRDRTRARLVGRDINKRQVVVVKDKVKRVIVNKDKDLFKREVVNDNGNVRKDDIAKKSYDEYIEEVRDNIRKTRDDRDYGKRYGIDDKKSNKNSYKDRDIKKVIDKANNQDEKDLVVDELRVKIIKRLRNDFDKKLSELEVLESELYFIEKDNDKELELEKVRKLKKEIKDIIDKINNIIDEYNIYARNYGFENVIDINDGVLVDDIINFRDAVALSDNKSLVNDYKLMSEFQDLYSKLDYISGIANNLIDKNQNKINEYDVRDKKYNQIKADIVKKENVLDKCDEEIDRQNQYFKELMGKISKIDSRSYNTYKFRGIDNLVGQSLRYIGLLMVSPLAGLIPSIAINTLATRKMISNIYKNMSVEKVTKVEYMAVDYEREINDKINDIDYTYDLIDDTINMIGNLKEDFMKQYNPNIKGYSETLRKIDRIGEKIQNNRYKMDIIKSNLISSKKINSDKLVKVRELNKSS